MKLLQEPLLHFVLAGAVLFGAYSLLNRSDGGAETSDSKQLRIGEGEVRWLTETWTLQRQRLPTQDELRGLVQEYLNEELLAREARELKLDENDAIIRRRLGQKLTFLIEDTLRRAEPTDADLQQIYDAHPERFKDGARVSFTHVYFNPTSRADAASDAKSVLASLSAAPRAEDIGDRFLLASEFRDQNERSVTATFGAHFARKLFTLEPQVWSGPIESGFGLHLVRISELRAGQLRPFADVRAQLVDEWRYRQEKATRESYLGELHKKYNVVIDDKVKPLLAPAATATGAAQ